LEAILKVQGNNEIDNSEKERILQHLSQLDLEMRTTDIINEEEIEESFGD
jgi:hypothetical protein